MKVTVMITVYNGEKYISECIESILKQTYTNFELLIVDDGSTDNTRRLIRDFKDSRIRLIENTHDYIHSLNIGLNNSRGEYIARIDADDIMMPERLQKQVALMDKMKNIDICASWCETFGKMSKIISINTGEIKKPLAQLLCGNVFCHNTIMIRKRFLIENNLAYNKYDYAEDYKLWCEAAKKGGVFYVIPEVLVRYRLSEEQISSKKREEQKYTSRKIQNELLEHIIYHETFQYQDKLIKVFEEIYKLNKLDIVSADTVIYIVYRLYDAILKNNN